MSAVPLSTSGHSTRVQTSANDLTRSAVESVRRRLVNRRLFSSRSSPMARVLVIDDDARTLFAYKQILRLAGHGVATAALGEDGVAAALRDEFDVVLCDQRLPDIPGIAV